MLGRRRAEVLPGGGAGVRRRPHWLARALPLAGALVLLYVLYVASQVLGGTGDGGAANAAEVRRQEEGLACARGFMHVTYEATFDDFRSERPAWDWKAVREVLGPFTAAQADDLLLEVDLLGQPLLLRPQVGEREVPRELERLLDAFGGAVAWDEWEKRPVYSSSDLRGAFLAPPESLLQHKGIEEVHLELAWPNSQPQTRIVPWRTPGGTAMPQVPLRELVQYLSFPSGKRETVTTEHRLEDAQYCFSTDELFAYPAVPLVAIRPSAVSGSAFHTAIIDAAQPYLAWLTSSNSAPIWTRIWRSSVQIGAAGSVTRMHWDEPALGTQAIFTISGLKRVVLVPAYDFEKQFSGVDLFQPLTPQFNLQPSHPLRYREPHFVDVRAGEVLLVPAGWLHATYHPVDTVGSISFEF